MMTGLAAEAQGAAEHAQQTQQALEDVAGQLQRQNEATAALQQQSADKAARLARMEGVLCTCFMQVNAFAAHAPSCWHPARWCGMLCAAAYPHCSVNEYVHL